MSTFGDLQNGLLQRCRQTGVNWGGTPTNTSTSLLPPYRVKMELNQAYNRVLALVKDFQVATTEVRFTPVANTYRFSLNPVPAYIDSIPSVRQTSVTATGTTVTFDRAPKNGNKVVVVVCSAGAVSAYTVTDSNGTSLSQQAYKADSSTVNSLALYDYTVSSSPDAIYTVSAAATQFIFAYELEAVGSIVVSTTSGTTTTNTITQSGVSQYSIQIAGVIAAGDSTSAAATLSNGSSTVDITTGYQYLSHAAASSTASSTATIYGYGTFAGFFAYYPPSSSSQVTYNPAAMQVYEYKYTQSGGQVRYIPFVSDQRYRQYTAGYNQVNASFSAFPDVLRQSFGQRVVDAFPGYSPAAGDTITLTICPDPLATSAIYSNTQVTCAAGNIMYNISDVPILPAQYHQFILEGAIMVVARDLDKDAVFKDAKAVWDAFTQECEDFGSSVAEGDAQQVVVDTWGGAVSSDFFVN